MNNWNNPYEPGSLAYNLYEAQNRQPQQPLQVPKNLGEWLAGVGLIFGLFGLFPALRYHHESNLAFVEAAVGNVLYGMSLVLAVYAVISGPKLIFKLIVWAMRKSVIVKLAVWGGLSGAVLGTGLAISMNDEILRGITRLGSMGLMIGAIIGGLLWTRSRSLKS